MPKNNEEYYLNSIFKLDKQFIFSEGLSLENVLKECVRTAPAIMNSKVCNLKLADGLNIAFKEKRLSKIEEGVTGKVFATKKPIIANDAASRRRRPRSLVCVPILLNKEIIGTLTVYDKKSGKFTEGDQKLLLHFANHIAILIDNVRTHKKILASYMNTIKTLASAVETRDSYMQGHSEKVTGYAMEIADVMKLPKEDSAMLAYCGRLHDIGKIAISDSILNKPGALTLSERAEIELHPVKAVEILAELKFLENGIPAIRHHHERFDGNGYPDRLKGETIPLLARVITCADAFDAMTSDRSYKPRMELKEAFEELKVNRGKQFDPYIADAFLDILQKVKK